MSEQSKHELAPVRDTNRPPPVLEYRPPCEERQRANAADLLAAAIAIGLGTVMLIGAVAILAQIALGRFEGFALIFALCLLGTSAAGVRTAWYYIGGWNHADENGSNVQKTLMPWRWRLYDGIGNSLQDLRMGDPPISDVPPSHDTAHPVPLLDYRPPRDERKRASVRDLLAGALAVVIGTLLLALCCDIVIVVARDPLDAGEIEAAAIAIPLLLVGAAASVRSAWFYFGGWDQTADRGKMIRKILRPWRWR